MGGGGGDRGRFNPFLRTIIHSMHSPLGMTDRHDVKSEDRIADSALPDRPLLATMTQTADPDPTLSVNVQRVMSGIISNALHPVWIFRSDFLL